MSQAEMRKFTAPVPSAFETMTFPTYRSLLSLEPQPRHPEMGQTKLVQPVAIGVWWEGVPAGLLVAEIPTGDSGDAEMLSLSCRAAFRNRGLGTALVKKLEEVLAEKGVSRVHAVYMTGKPSIPFVERILSRCGWSTPMARTLTVRFTPEEAANTPWFGRVRLLESDYQLFPWETLAQDERAEIARSHQDSPWIAPGLEPWFHDRYGFEPASSLGLRFRGEVVGWVINHRLSSDTVRFTCSFVRKPLGRRGRIMPVFSESIKRARDAGFRTCTFVTPVRFRTMISFIERRCASWAGFVGETRGSMRSLSMNSRQ